MRLLAWVKQFISRRDEMSMAIIKLGHMSIVLTPERAMALAEAISDSEIYEYSYARDENGEAVKTQHIYPNDFEGVDVEVISDTQYKMYKLAGKPNKA